MLTLATAMAWKHMGPHIIFSEATARVHCLALHCCVATLFLSPRTCSLEPETCGTASGLLLQAHGAQWPGAPETEDLERTLLRVAEGLGAGVIPDLVPASLDWDIQGLEQELQALEDDPGNMRKDECTGVRRTWAARQARQHGSKQAATGTEPQ